MRQTDTTETIVALNDDKDIELRRISYRSAENGEWVEFASAWIVEISSYGSSAHAEISCDSEQGARAVFAILTRSTVECQLFYYG